MKIHPTAILGPQVELEKDVEIGPYSVIVGEVKIGKSTKIGPHVYINGWTEIGQNCNIHFGCIIGHEPQVKGYKGEKTFVKIGNNNIIREYTTIHRGSEEDSSTIIGDDNYIMANVHIAHNCKIGNSVTITNYTGLTGYVEVEDEAVISGLVAIHQFVRIGRLAMIGGNSKVVQDVPPFTLADGHPACIFGLNTVGLKRRNIPPLDRSQIKQAYKILYLSKFNTSEALAEIQKNLNGNPYIEHFVSFIKKSQRGICPHGTRRANSNHTQANLYSDQ
jgi:UDP-N-acetylglucosamine acyltransferase